MVGKTRRKFLEHGAVTDPDLADEQHGFCVQLIDTVLEWDSSEPFDKPVLEKWPTSDIPGYFDAVKKPMDFRTIKETLQKRGGYRNKRTNLFDFRFFMKDVYLIVDNCLAYNREGEPIADMAEQLEKDIHKEMKSMSMSTEKKGSLRAKRNTPSSHDEREKEVEEERYSEIEAEEDVEMEDVVPIPRKEKKEKVRKKEKVKVENVKVEEQEEPVIPNGESENEGLSKATGKEPVDSGGKARHVSTKESKNEVDMDDYAVAKREYEELKMRKRKLREVIEGVDAKRMERVEQMSDEELMKLRDTIENSSFGQNEEVVKILHTAVEEAIEKGSEKDPETITVQLEQVEPRPLMLVHYMFYPDLKREELMKKLDVISGRIAEAKAQVKSLKRPSSSSVGQGDTKKVKYRK